MEVVLQQNMGGAVEVLTAQMETAVERGADLVWVQEPPAFEGVRQPGFDFLRTRGRVLAAERVDLDWTVTTEDKFYKSGGG